MTQSFATEQQLIDALDSIRQSPSNRGIIRLIVRRPARAERECIERAELDPVAGLVGDNWSTRGSSRTTDGTAHPDMQLTLMNARAAAAIAGPEERWPIAGDQLYVDLDLSAANLPPGTRLAVGTAVVEVTDQPHTGCKKFAERFGIEATRFINSPEGRALQLRGINTKVITGGTVATGDSIAKLSA